MSRWRKKKGFFRGSPNPWDYRRRIIERACRVSTPKTSGIDNTAKITRIRKPGFLIPRSASLLQPAEENYPGLRERVEKFVSWSHVPAWVHLPGGSVQPPYQPPPPRKVISAEDSEPPRPRPFVPHGDWTHWIRSLASHRKRIKYLDQLDTPISRAESDRLDCEVLKGFLLSSLLHFHRSQGLSFDAWAVFSNLKRHTLASQFAPWLKSALAAPCALAIDRDRRVEPGHKVSWLSLISPHEKERVWLQVRNRDCELAFSFQRIKAALPPLGIVLRKASIANHGKILSQDSGCSPNFALWCSRVTAALYPKGWMSGRELAVGGRWATRSAALGPKGRIPRSQGGGQRAVYLGGMKEEEVEDSRWVRDEGGEWRSETIWRGLSHVEVGEVPLLELNEQTNTVEVVQVADPLKARTVTLCHFGANVLRPMQKRMHGILRRNPVFELIGHAVTGKSLSSIQGPIINSADYSAATDGIFRGLTEAVVRTLLSRMDWSGVDRQTWSTLEQWAIATLTRNLIRLPDGTTYEQKRGQLMGSILSFPILCIINFSMWSWSQLRVARSRLTWIRSIPVDSRNVPLDSFGILKFLSNHSLSRRLPVRINGDDLVSAETELTMASFRRSVSAMGCSLSIGKTFESSTWLTINSTLWRKIGRFYKQHRTPNWSALYRPGFLDGQQSRIEWEEQGRAWSSLLTEWLRSWPPHPKTKSMGLRWRIFKEAISLYSGITMGPEKIGRSGIFPLHFRLSYSDRVRLLSPTILMDTPPSQSKLVLELLSRRFGGLVPGIDGIKIIDPSSPPAGWTDKDTKFWTEALEWARGLAGRLTLRIPEAQPAPRCIMYLGEAACASTARENHASLLVPIGKGVRYALTTEGESDLIDLDQLPFVLSEVEKLPPKERLFPRSWWETREVAVPLLRSDPCLGPPVYFGPGTVTTFGGREISPLDYEEWLFVSIDPEDVDPLLGSVVPAPDPRHTRDKLRRQVNLGGAFSNSWRAVSHEVYTFVNLRIQTWLIAQWRVYFEEGMAIRPFILPHIEPFSSEPGRESVTSGRVSSDSNKERLAPRYAGTKVPRSVVERVRVGHYASLPPITEESAPSGP